MVSRKHINLLKLAPLLVFSLFMILNLNKPLIEEEWHWAASAEGINTHGSPIYYAGENAINKPGLFHGPLYQYLVAFAFKALGVSTFSARSLGYIFGLITIILIFFVSKEIFQSNKSSEGIALTACILYATHPFVIQGFSFLDIDNTLITALFTLFTFLFIKWNKPSCTNWYIKDNRT